MHPKGGACARVVAVADDRFQSHALSRKRQTKKNDNVWFASSSRRRRSLVADDEVRSLPTTAYIKSSALQASFSRTRLRTHEALITGKPSTNKCVHERKLGVICDPKREHVACS